MFFSTGFDWFPAMKRKHYFIVISGMLACKVYENMRRESAAMKIQTNIRRHHARNAYNKLRVSVLVLQMGARAVAARKEFMFRKRTKAATVIQVIF